MKRLFVIRKDLKLSFENLTNVVAYCAVAYWMNMLKYAYTQYKDCNPFNIPDEKTISTKIDIPKDVWDEYVNGNCSTMICECQSLEQLRKVELRAIELGLQYGLDYGYAIDTCITDISMENKIETHAVGLWFKPMKDDVVDAVSKNFKKFQLEI